MPLETFRWDPTSHLDSAEALEAYIDAVLEDGDPALVAAALGDVARAIGMTRIAAEIGLSRESLYDALARDEDEAARSAVLQAMTAFKRRLSAMPSAAE